MSPTHIHSFLAAVGAGLASLSLACASHKTPLDEEVKRLVDLSRDSNAALLRGDGELYGSMIRQTQDFTLMSPFGGKPTYGAASPERMKEIGKFFKNGSLEQELVHAYSSPDMVVLATIERAHVAVGDLPAQDWALRVTLVYRRDGAEWRLAHRHADPLSPGISVAEAARLARGEPRTGG